MPGRLRFSFLLPGLVIFTGILSCGCGNNLDSVNAISNPYSDPVMSAKNIEVVFSDSGKIQGKLYSVLLNRFEGKDPYLEFPKGFRIEMFDSALRVETTIRAQYGKRREIQRIMEAKGNVIVRNEIKNEQLNTDHLIWDENHRKIYSDVAVKITTPDKVLFGKGLESNESFTRYRIIGVTGQMTVKKDSL
jgi:LPS export ABC transporter protein LptC